MYHLAGKEKKEGPTQRAGSLYVMADQCIKMFGQTISHGTQINTQLPISWKGLCIIFSLTLSMKFIELLIQINNLKIQTRISYIFMVNFML